MMTSQPNPLPGATAQQRSLAPTAVQGSDPDTLEIRIPDPSYAKFVVMQQLPGLYRTMAKTKKTRIYVEIPREHSQEIKEILGESLKKFDYRYVVRNVVQENHELWVPAGYTAKMNFTPIASAEIPKATPPAQQKQIDAKLARQMKKPPAKKAETEPDPEFD